MKFRNFSRLFDSQFQRKQVNNMLLSRPVFRYDKFGKSLFRHTVFVIRFDLDTAIFTGTVGFSPCTLIPLVIDN